jgi:hypothetical protein
MRALLVIALGLIAVGLMFMVTGCDLDKARGSGATKHHADQHDKRDNDDKDWDEATAPLTCETAPWPTDPVEVLHLQRLPRVGLLVLLLQSPPCALRPN